MLDFNDIVNAFEQQEENDLTILFNHKFYYLKAALVKYLDEEYMFEDISNDDKILLDKVIQIQRKPHIYLPNQNDFDEFKYALDFLYTLNQSSYDYLNSMVHDHGTFRHFKEGCLHLGIYNDWLKYKEEKLTSFLKAWCEKKGINYI